MTALVLDSGALIALDRNDRAMWAILRVANDEGDAIRVPAGTIAQAWRDGSRQALLIRALRYCEEVPLDGPVARAAGLLCGRTATADVIDASVAVAAAGSARYDDVAVLTSDPHDLSALLATLEVDVHIIPV